MPISNDRAHVTYRSLIASLRAQEAHPRELFKVLRAYYHNNGLYDELRDRLLKMGVPAKEIVSLRNPAHRCVEFYPMKLWPGDTLDEAFTITAKRDAIVEPIKQIWTWSNWAAQRQVAARWDACDGNLFIKCAQNDAGDQVFFQLIEAQYVSELYVDERGFITYIRIDIPRLRRVPGKDPVKYWYTEEWDKGNRVMRSWEHEKGPDTPVAHLGAPKSTLALSRREGATGPDALPIDFIPIVHVKFLDMGELWGVSAFLHAIEKIDDANRSAANLHAALFRHNKVLWALKAGGVDAMGRPLPPPEIDPKTQGRVKLGDEEFISLPGNASLESLVPQLQYEAALNILKSHMSELEEDLPEMAYYRLHELGRELSGVAVRLLLSPALDKLAEARAAAVAGLIRANQMALTIGAAAGLFEGVGTYENGDFQHSIALADAIPLTEGEKLTLAQQKRGLDVSQRAIWKEMGYSEQEIEEMWADYQKSRTMGEQFLSTFESGARS